MPVTDQGRSRGPCRWRLTAGVRALRPVSVFFVLALVPLWAGCSVSTFVCGVDDECGAGGRCEAQKVCSFIDPSCPSGRRYGRYSGEYADECTWLGEPPVAIDDPTMGSDDEGGSGSIPSATTGGDSRSPVGETAEASGTSGTSGTSPPQTSGFGDETSTGAPTLDSGEAEGESSGVPAAPEALCDLLYGGLEDYALCEIVDAACMFYAHTSGSCGNACADMGGACVTAYHDIDNTCDIAAEVGCGHPAGSLVCVCDG